MAAGGAGLVLAGVLGLSLVSGRGGDSGEAASGAVAAPEGAEQAQDQSTAAGAGPVVLSSGTDYVPEAASVQALLPGLLGDAAAPAARSAQEEAAQAPVPAAAAAPTLSTFDLTSDALARLREPAALRACLEAVARTAAGSAPEVDPVALDYARTGGAPALVVVQRAGAGLVEVTAVGPACSADDPARLWSLRLPG